MSLAAMFAAGSEMELGVVALLAFGLIVVMLFGRVLFGGSGKSRARSWSDSSSRRDVTLHAHGPRHTGARRPASSLNDDDRLAQLDQLVAKGHITPEDYARAKHGAPARRG